MAYFLIIFVAGFIFFAWRGGERRTEFHDEGEQILCSLERREVWAKQVSSKCFEIFLRE